MIEINLVPSHLKRKRKKQTSMGIINIPKEAVIGLIGGLFVLLFAVHIVLTIVMVIKFTRNAKIENKLNGIKKEWEVTKGVKQEMRLLQSKIDAIEKVTIERRISWARKLNEISDSIPKGVWLNKLSLDRKVLLIDGSAVSRTKEKDEMINVGIFTSNLKNQTSFMSGLGNIEVSSIQRRQIKSVEVADFLITIRLQ